MFFLNDMVGYVHFLFYEENYMGCKDSYGDENYILVEEKVTNMVGTLSLNGREKGSENSHNDCIDSGAICNQATLRYIDLSLCDPLHLACCSGSDCFGGHNHQMKVKKYHHSTWK